MSLSHNDIHGNDFDLSKYTKPHTQNLGHFTHMAVFNTQGLSRFGNGENKPFFYSGNNEHQSIPGSDEYYVQIYNELEQNVNLLTEHQKNELKLVNIDLFKERPILEFNEPEGKNEAKKSLDFLYKCYQEELTSMDTSFGRQRRSKRKLYRGPKGGQYYIKKGRKIYIK